jgi:hypothetical protein
MEQHRTEEEQKPKAKRKALIIRNATNKTRKRY